MPEEKAEDIVSRLEALRKKVPEEEKPPEKPIPEKRRRIARIVGIFVIFLFIFVVSFAGYNLILKPIKEKKEIEIAARKAAEKEFLKAKSEKLKEIEEAFEGLPSKYAVKKIDLIKELKKATGISQVHEIDVKTPATEGWRAYKRDEADALMAENIAMTIDEEMYKGYGKVIEKISQLSYVQLKKAVIRKFYREYFPMRLSRDQAGWMEPGIVVNIWLREGENVTSLAKGAKVIAVMRGKESGEIKLSEEESKIKSGSGAEGKGPLATIPVPTSGGIGSLEVPGAGSAGYATAFYQTSFEVSISEIQKVLAAGKLSEHDLEENLRKYGYELGKIENEMGIGDLEAEYLILFEVSEDEVPGLVSKASPTSPDRKNIFVTIATPAGWVERIK